MLSIHPIIQISATCLGLYVFYLGVQRFRSLHLKQKVKFNWKRHVLLGKIVMATWLAGILGGLSIVYMTWHGFLVTGIHGKVALVILPLILYIVVVFADKNPGVRLYKIAISPVFANTTYRNIGQLRQASQTLLGVIALMNISTFLYFIEIYFNAYLFGLYGISLWIINLAAISIFILIRYFNNKWNIGNLLIEIWSQVSKIIMLKTLPMI